jgi:hypothetical protein
VPEWHGTSMDNYWWQHQVESTRELDVMDSQIWIRNRRIRRTHRVIERQSRDGIALAKINVKVAFIVQCFKLTELGNWSNVKISFFSR